MYISTLVITLDYIFITFRLKYIRCKIIFTSKIASTIFI